MVGKEYVILEKARIKNNVKTIRKTKKRFISILTMAFLGVGFYSGLVATSPDMLESLDSFADTSHLFDIRVVSTLGLEDEDVTSIEEIEGVEKAFGIKTKDTIVLLEEKEKIAKVIGYQEEINTPVIIAGRNIENTKECLLDAHYNITESAENYIGKKIVLVNEEKNENEEFLFKERELEIVGVVQSPIYIAKDRGNTNIGNGSIDLFVYCQNENIKLDYYTEIGVTVEGAKEEQTDSTEYLARINPVYQKVEEIKQEREQVRYHSLVAKANEKVDEAQKEYDTEKQKVETDMQEAESKINEAEETIQNSEKKIQRSERELQEQEQKTKQQFLEAESKIQEAEKEIEHNRINLENAKQELESKKEEAQNGIKQIEKNLSIAGETLETLQKQKEQMQQIGADTTKIEAEIIKLQETITQLERQKGEIQRQLTEAETKIIEAETQIKNGNAEIEKQKETLEKSKVIANNEIKNGKAKIASGKEELEKGKRELTSNRQKFQEAREEAEVKLKEAQEEIDKARQEIKNIEKAKWYIQDRKDNTGYTNIFDAIKTMNNIANVFPIIFYLVSVLISLTSMTRMIEEERIEIGTLKALGYTNLSIISKYMLYAFMACSIGGILGMSIGFYLLPSIVWKIYSMLYTLPKFYLSYRFDIGFIGTLIAFLCIGGATIFVAYKELRETPSSLMRPKPPKNRKEDSIRKALFFMEENELFTKSHSKKYIPIQKKSNHYHCRNCRMYRINANRLWH